MLKGNKMLMAAGLVLLSLGSCQKEDYKIQSDPDEFAVFPLAIPVAAEGGEYILNVTGHEDWTISLTGSNTSAEGWCTLSQTSGSGAAEVKLTVTSSTSFVKNRQVIIEVANDEKTLRSKVIQETLTLGPNEVLINGMVWSTLNVNNPGEFCTAPDEVGMYYQFNSKKAWPSSGATPVPGWDASTYVYEEVDWQRENDPCPEGWRVPTSAEFMAVYEKGSYRLEPDQSGYKCWGLVLGLPDNVAQTANKDNIKSLGGIFIPQSGWINAEGNYDRTWLTCLRHGTSLSKTHGGMFLSDYHWYTDAWGWGDGQKERASAVRCVMDITIED